MGRSLEKVETGGASRRAATRDVERSLDQLSRVLDGLFRIPGTNWRIGLDSLVGLVPGVGDFATTAVSVYILAAGVRYGVPRATLLRMAANIGVDYLLGSVPIVGDIFDAAWKSNIKNVELLRERMALSETERREARTSDWLFLAAIVLGLVLLLAGSIVAGLWLLSWIVAAFLPA